MPWWSKALWALRHNLRNAYKLKSPPNPSEEVLANYRNLKATYQRVLRKKKKESWETLCSNNLNNDVFGTMKNFSSTFVPASAPSKLAKNGVIITDPKEILLELSSYFFPAVRSDEKVHTDTIASVSSAFETVSEPLIITMVELDLAVEHLKDTTSSGPGGFSAIWLKIY